MKNGYLKEKKARLRGNDFCSSKSRMAAASADHTGDWLEQARVYPEPTPASGASDLFASLWNAPAAHK